jgi:hypothetical protein
MVTGQPGQRSLQDPISVEKQLGVVVHTCYPSYSRKQKIGGSQPRPAWAKAKPYLQKRTVGVAQVVGHLPSSIKP